MNFTKLTKPSQARSLRFAAFALAMLASSCRSGDTRPSEKASPTGASPLPTVAVQTTTAVPRSVDCNASERVGDEVKVVVRYRCIAVRGDSAPDLVRQLALGGRSAGTATWRISETMRWSGFEGSTCSMDWVRVEMELDYFFPRWAGPAERPTELVHAWGDLLVDMEDDLADLQRGVARAGRAVRDALSEFSYACGGFEAAAKKVAHRVFKRHSDPLEKRRDTVDFDVLVEAA